MKPSWNALFERNVFCLPSTGITGDYFTFKVHNLLKVLSTSAFLRPHPRNRLNTFSASSSDSGLPCPALSPWPNMTA